MVYEFCYYFNIHICMNKFINIIHIWIFLIFIILWNFRWEQLGFYSLRIVAIDSAGLIWCIFEQRPPLDIRICVCITPWCHTDLSTRAAFNLIHGVRTMECSYLGIASHLSCDWSDSSYYYWSWIPCTCLLGVDLIRPCTHPHVHEYILHNTEWI